MTSRSGVRPAGEAVEAALARTQRQADASPPAPWHAMQVEDVLRATSVGADGLNEAEARRRLARIGRNELPAPPRIHPALRFLLQFNNALIYFLLAAAAAAALLNHLIDAVVIIAVVVVNAIVGFIQEGRAERALDAIRGMIAPLATVRRGGQRRVVAASDIVPGDVVLVEAGDKIPADLRLMRARNLLADEAVLTGESVPVEKDEAPVPADVVLGDRRSMLHSGTFVATGQGSGVAVETGPRTEIGQISSLIGRVQPLATPLLQQITRFGRLFTVVAGVASVLLFAFAVVVRDFEWVDALMVVVAVAVGAVPEGLPAVITITLALGVQRMAARHAVVRRLPAVETLGATSTICTDKTGTLTRNEMTVRRILAGAGEILVEGVGYAPRGDFKDANGSPVRPDGSAELLLRAGLLCNDALTVEKDGSWSVLGDPMEGALVSLAMKAGMDPHDVRQSWRRADEIPFDARHRYMATLNIDLQGRKLIFVKGAPERVLSMCSTQCGGTGQIPTDVEYWHHGIAEAAGHGERVLGFAYAPAPEGLERLQPGDVERGLVFLGLTGFIDPPREEALAAVADCRSAGVAVKMITGDHAQTALAIARQLALSDDPQVVSGAELDTASDADLRKLVERASVFARASPEHKLRIVRALQGNGHIVAMTGDGVNDAPALKQADVGVAMGRKGTEAAKETAEMVLLDDNFASIVAAVREGRTVYDNIRKVIAWMLPTNGGEVLCVVVAILAGISLPMTPVQILWINLVLEVSLALVLAVEPSEPGVMQRPPRSRNAPLLSKFLVWRVVLVSFLFMIGVFGVFEYAMRQGLGEQVARTMVVNTIMVMEIFYLFNVRYLHMTSFSLRGAVGTPAVLAAIAVVVVAQLAFTYLPFMHTVFDTAPISLFDGLVIISVGIVLMVVLEAEKALMRRFGLLENPGIRQNASGLA